MGNTNWVCSDNSPWEMQVSLPPIWSRVLLDFSHFSGCLHLLCLLLIINAQLTVQDLIVREWGNDKQMDLFPRLTLTTIDLCPFPRDIFGHSRHYWGALDRLNLYCTPYLPEKNKKRIYLARLRTARPPKGGAGYHYGADWWPMDISRPNVIVTLSRSWVYLYLSWWISLRLMWVSIYTPKEHKADIPGQDRSLYDLITLGTVRTPSMV